MPRFQRTGANYLESKVLKRFPIGGLRVVKKLDPELYGFVARHALENGHFLAAPEADLRQYRGYLEKIVWNPNRKHIYTDFYKGKPRIGAVTFVHEMVHSLFFQSNRRRTLTDPNVVLLAECAASSIDLYFNLLILLNSELNYKKFCEFFTEEFDRDHDRIQIEQHMSEIRTPKDILRWTSEFRFDFFGIIEVLHRMILKNKSSGKVDYGPLHIWLESASNRWIFRQYDVANNLLFALTYAERPLDFKWISKRLKLAQTKSTMLEQLQVLLEPRP